MNLVVTEREYDLSLKFVQTAGEIQSPISQIASDVFLAQFGWPENVGKKKAKLAIEKMEKKGEVECERVGKNKMLKLVRIKPQVLPIVALASVLKPKTEIPEVRSHSFKNFKNHKKGYAKNEHEKYTRGDANEAFFHKSCERLVEILTKKFPNKVLFGDCSRSGRNNPKNGKIDLQDRYGEDVSMRLTVRCGEGQFRKVFLIYDAKSSKRQTERFNRNIKFLPGQEGADIKMAFWVDRKVHTERDVIEGVLKDMITFSLIDFEFKEEVMMFV